MDEKEFNAVIRIPANVRYEHFIKQVADRETVWGLYDGGWADHSAVLEIQTLITDLNTELENYE